MACECGVEPSNRDFGIEVQGVFDGVLFYQCYSCKGYWPRFNVPSKLHDRSVQIIAGWVEQDKANKEKA